MLLLLTCYAWRHYVLRKNGGTRLHRVFSAIFGLVLVVAGLVAAGYIEIDFKAGRLLSGAVGMLVPGVLMLSAFYMAFKLLKFAASGKK
jgi:uncharacterized membrane protein YjjP (DUF1212 family)